MMMLETSWHTRISSAIIWPGPELERQSVTSERHDSCSPSHAHVIDLSTSTVSIVQDCQL